MKVRYFVNEEKKRIVCLLETKRGMFRGKAKLNSIDKWDIVIGKNVAMQKAKISLLKERARRYTNKVKMFNKQSEIYAKLGREAVDEAIKEGNLIRTITKGEINEF